jgi:hypothetical protein
VGEALRLVKGVGAALGPVPTLRAAAVRTRGAAPAPRGVVVPLHGPEADVVVTVRPVPPDEFEVTLAVSGRAARGWEVRWSAEGAPEESTLRAEGGTASVRLRAGRYHFACVSAAGEGGPRFRLVLEGAG